MQITLTAEEARFLAMLLNNATIQGPDAARLLLALLGKLQAITAAGEQPET